jgi:ribosome-associated protein
MTGTKASNIQRMSEEHISDDQDVADKPSKSELKRRMSALQKIGEQLAAMPFERVKHSPASEKLIQAIEEYHHSKSHEGRRRQRQYVGKVMRNEDGQALADWINGETLDQKLEVTRMHAAEQWRDRMLAEPSLLTSFIEHYPEAKNADLHALIRNARLEKEKNKPPKSARELYKLLKQFISGEQGNDQTHEQHHPKHDDEYED